ncbi:FKBP-type peptidyl-prolyl cis-trans isomerase [Flavobacterium sediminis]|uniref:FKBP-type peptidyl-prolyl cis-trans isomerase n=1 Tax=Flavobacterium sediminis TaxID=2201181 RepID=UPI0014765822|nr:FKBP-type peptidyl-prolyl cis-trans isomerase [Flavobacterium sediminis]
MLYVITQKGTNQKPEPGTSVKVAYSGFFNDGKLFDSSNPEVAKLFGRYDLRREQSGNYGPIESTIGQHRFIAGFAEGVDLLHYGEKATLFIPSKLAYGEKGAGGGLIPPNTDLVFEIELVK